MNKTFIKLCIVCVFHCVFAPQIHPQEKELGVPNDWLQRYVSSIQPATTNVISRIHRNERRKATISPIPHLEAASIEWKVPRSNELLVPKRSLRDSIDAGMMLDAVKRTGTLNKVP